MAAARSAPEASARAGTPATPGRQTDSVAAPAAGVGPRRATPRVGILGGTFNPPHLAHLALARAALSELELERVLVVPARLAPQKTSIDDPGQRHRLRMCELAFGGEERLEVSTLELDRPAPSYTVDTLRLIHSTNPDAKLVLIVGADTARSLPDWREPREIVRLAELAVAGRKQLAREGVQSAGAEDVRSVVAEDVRSNVRKNVQSAVRSVDERARVTFLAMPPLALSSSQVRARVAAGQPIGEMVGAEVARYIDEHGLYRTAVAA